MVQRMSFYQVIKKYPTLILPFLIKHASDTEPDKVEYLNLFWEGGHKKVKNPNPETVDIYKFVTMMYLYQNNPSFKNQIDSDFENWKKLKHSNTDLTNFLKNFNSRSYVPDSFIQKSYPLDDLENYGEYYTDNTDPIELDSLVQQYRAKNPKVSKSTAEDFVVLDLGDKYKTYVNKIREQYNLTDEALVRLTGVFQKQNKPKAIELSIKKYNSSIEDDFDNLDSEVLNDLDNFSLNLSHENRDMESTFKVKYHKENGLSLELDNIVIQNNGNELGSKILFMSLREALNLNIPKMTMTALRDDEIGSVGYKVWPKMGFDGDLKQVLMHNPNDEDSDVLFLDHIKKDNPELYGKLEKSQVDDKYKTQFTIQNLYSLGPEAISYWSKYGDSMDMEFDLTEGSKSLDIFNRSLFKKISKHGNVESWLNA